MIKFLEKHRTIRRIVVLTIVCIFVYGILFIVSGYQEYVREQNTYQTTLTPVQNEIPAYDVDGMTEEEIIEMLEQQRKANSLEE